MLKKLPSVWGKHLHTGDQVYAPAGKNQNVPRTKQALISQSFPVCILTALGCKSQFNSPYQPLIAPETSSPQLLLSSLPASSPLPGKAAGCAVLALSYAALLGCTAHAAR